MLNSFRISTLAAALAVATAGLVASSAAHAASQPNLKGTEFDRPDVLILNSGIEVSPNEHSVFYSWDEVNRRIQAEGVKQMPAAGSQGMNAVPAAAHDLRGTAFDRPDVTVYSWGVEVGQGGYDSQTRYTWDEVNKKINADRMANRY